MHDATRVYEIVFVVVAFSVIVQGTSIPFVAPALGIPMRLAEPRATRRLVVEAGSRADGTTITNLTIGRGSWVERIVRDGAEVRARGSLALRDGDVVWVIADADDVGRLGAIFRASREG